MADPIVPAKVPCPTCPYRCDVPSGVWAPSEYERLPAYDGPTWAQPMAVFFCHQANGCVCSGWASVHGDEENMALRVALVSQTMTEADVDAVIGYVSPVPLFASGAEAAAHGMQEIDAPGRAALDAMAKMERKRARRGSEKVSAD